MGLVRRAESAGLEAGEVGEGLVRLGHAMHVVFGRDRRALALVCIEKRVKDVPSLEVFEKAIENVRPNIEVRSKRVGGSNYQVPTQVTRKRQQSLAFRWLRDAFRSRKGRNAYQSLAQELLDAYKGEGTAVTTKDNVHRMAEANKAFAHFARF